MSDLRQADGFSGIRDNHKRGKVGDFLREKIQSGSKLSFVSAYFTIYAYEMMRTHLESADSLRFLFGEPRFVRNIDPDKTDKKAFDIEDSKLQLQKRLEQRRVGGQLIRSGTSVGANYRAACRGRSKAEFAAKIVTVAEEADECCFWLELIVEGGLLKDGLINPLLDEANELTAIFTAAAKTSRLANQQSKIDNRKS
jgi:four helix bundle protein